MMTLCAVLSAPWLSSQVCRTEFQYREPVRVRLGYLPALSVPPNRIAIVRAHRLTGYSRLRAARGAIPNKARLGALSESSSAGILGNYPTQRRLAAQVRERDARIAALENVRDAVAYALSLGQIVRESKGKCAIALDRAALTQPAPGEKT